MRVIYFKPISASLFVSILIIGLTSVLVSGESITLTNNWFVRVVSVNATLYVLGPHTQFEESVVPEIVSNRSLVASRWKSKIFVTAYPPGVPSESVPYFTDVRIKGTLFTILEASKVSPALFYNKKAFVQHGSEKVTSK